MNKISSLLVIVSCIFVAATFFVPLWYITLEAPQYPGGLTMYIWLSQITGTDEFTLQNVNILNHYIGMAAIHQDAFVELRIMPYVVMVLIASGIVVAIIRNKKLLAGWVLLLIVAGTVGLADFYRWQQAYGNDLDPNAPIKIEGMTYSPPFIGVKTILNITASSFPHLGGAAFGVGLLAALAAVYLAFRDNSLVARQAEKPAVRVL
jgi:copper chaperone NosL